MAGQTIVGFVAEKSELEHLVLLDQTTNTLVVRTLTVTFTVGSDSAFTRTGS